MKLTRRRITVLLNALYDEGITDITVEHPSEEIGELLRVDIEDMDEATVRFTSNREDFTQACADIDRKYGPPASHDIPDPNSYVWACLAGGLLNIGNRAELNDFLDRFGSPNLNAGHPPVVAGFDTNLMPWRIWSVLGLDGGYSPYRGEWPIVNGFTLATGVRDELDWDHKHNNTRPLEKAFGDEFDRFLGQPTASNREGRLGEIHYRQLRDLQYADEIECDTGDDEIVDGYDRYQRSGRKDVLLFSNDRNFVERARSHTIRAHHVDFPREFPRKTTGSWTAIRDTLYMLTILFGVIKIPKATLYGVWSGKTGKDWHDEAIDVECRSPRIEPNLKRDTAILDQFHS
ncbi:hypothetical protein [Salinibaculum rarum]|uniref:hypothetical protein n=1 Tax=Salinibaculum rarum TaxID=3058903 RepID=UPI00265F7708|nr:hypothetical protein [Salinibaculum sp. KK48]